MLSHRRGTADLLEYHAALRRATETDRGGGVTVFCGASEIGQPSDGGHRAEVFGIDTFDIRVYRRHGSRASGFGFYSSRVTIMAGNAALQAAERARALIAEAVAIKFDVQKEGCVDHQVYDAEAPERRVTFQEAVVLGGHSSDARNRCFCTPLKSAALVVAAAGNSWSPRGWSRWT